MVELLVADICPETAPVAALTSSISPAAPRASEVGPAETAAWVPVLDAGAKQDFAPWPPRQDPVLDLYLGTPGAALLLAAQASSSGDPRYRELCLSTIAATRLGVRANLAGRPPPGGRNLGAFVGTAATLYSLLVTGCLLDEPDLLAEAHDLSSLITPQAIREDKHLDVVFGSAGALLVLLALDRHIQEPNRSGLTPLQLAMECGSHLLRCRSAQAGSPRAWITSPGGPPRTGFSHGAAGIILALARLYERTGEPVLWQAVREGAAFERPHLRQRKVECLAGPPPSGPGVSWCHGAPGIALGRYGVLENTGTAGPTAGRDELAEDLAMALDITLRARQGNLDHLCCGNMGRVEILLRIAASCGSDELVGHAHALATGVLRAWKKRGRFALDSPPAEGSLFRGLPGIGYTLLRLIAPAALPCPLLAEGPFLAPTPPGDTACCTSPNHF